MNSGIKKKISSAGLKQWEVAAELGICERTLCVWLRQELTEDKKQRIQEAIEKLRGDKSNV